MAPSGNTFIVDMTAQITFSPIDLTIEVGDTVVWRSSAIGHTSTAGAPGNETGTWSSGFVAVGESFSFTFTEVGDFPYYCQVHGSFMSGSLTVVESLGGQSSAPPATPTTEPGDY